MTNINWCSWTDKNTEKNQNPNGTTILTLCKMGRNIIVIIHTFGAISIFYYFIITQRINMSNEELIFVWRKQYSSRKALKCSVGQQYPYSTRWEQNIVSILHIYGARAILLIFCDCQETGLE